MNAKRKLFESVGTGDMSWYYEDWQKIEENIAEELALRATDRGCINSHALKSVLKALNTMPIEVVYATWSGLGIFLITVFGNFVFQQSLEWRAILGLVMIVGGVVLVNTYALHK